MSAGISNGGAVQPKCLARRGNLLLAHGFAMHGGGALLVGRTPADDGLGANQRRPVGHGAGRGQRRGHGLAVLTVDLRQDVPAIGLETLRRVVVEPADHLAVDGNAVVVIDRDQLAELLHAGERGRLVRDPLHHAAVAHEHVGVVIDDGVAGAVEGGRQRALGQRHAHRIGKPLAQRAGGGFDPQDAARAPDDRRSWSRIAGIS